MSRDTWRVTTHDWSREVDAGHLVEARRVAASLGDALALHLALEVIAYADDEAQASGRSGVVRVVVQGELVEVDDDGRGTDTRRDETGQVVRKPVMATRDVRFFDAPDAPLLPDGLPRRGMSTVSASSPLLRHTNRRSEGAWTQAYRHGVPDSDLQEVEDRQRPGTTVAFVLPPGGRLDADRLRELASGFAHVTVSVTG